LPAQRLDIALSFADAANGRAVRLAGFGDWAERIRELLPNG
jgi:hypothetical protein